jgi:hypothetical protein
MHAALPREIVAAIRVSSWHALFSSLGYPEGITSSTDSSASIDAALRGADLPTPLARALFGIEAFSTDAARADAYSAAEALGQPPPFPDAASPQDFAALLFAAAARDPRASLLLAATRILRDRHFRPFSTHVYVGRRDRDGAIGEPSQYESTLSAAVSAWCARRGFGAVVSTSARAVSSVLHFDVVHEARIETAVTREGTAPHRPVRSHHLAYEPSARLLSITTETIEAVTPLASIAGDVFFGDERHFHEEAAVDLSWLQELGPRALEVKELEGELSSVKAIGGTWHSGKDHAMTPRGKDLFRALRRYKIRIEGGRLEVVTLRATRAAPPEPGAPAQLDIILRPPHEVSVSEPELAPLARRLLRAVKITHPAPRAPDFFSRQPWRDPAAAWIASEGEEVFRELAQRGLLVADASNRAVAPPAQPHAGRTATAHPLPGAGGRFLAVSADPTVPPFVVKEEDLVVYALSFEKLASALARACELTGPAPDLDDDGVLLCGQRALGPTHVVVSLLTRPIRVATAARLRDAAGYGHAILVAPEGRREGHGLHVIPIPKLGGPYRPMLQAMVRLLKLQAKVDTPLYAPEGARIVVHFETVRIWVDGVLCAAATETHARLLQILIEHAGQPVHTKDIAEHVAQGNQHSDTTRKAVESFFTAVEKSHRALKKKPPKGLREMIAQPKLGVYALKVPGFVD